MSSLEQIVRLARIQLDPGDTVQCITSHRGDLYIITKRGVIYKIEPGDIS